MEGFYGLLKLTTGEELIAKVVSDDGGNYLIEDPVQMFRNVAPNGMTWIQCSHWLLFNKSSLVNIRKEHVLAIVEDLNGNVIIMFFALNNLSLLLNSQYAPLKLILIIF